MSALNGQELKQAVQTLGLLMRRGFPLDKAVKALGDEQRGPWVEVSARVAEGDTLGSALRRYPHLFSPFFSGMVSAAETSQNGESILKTLSEWLEVSDSVREKVRDLLHYPTMLVSFLLMELGLVLGYGLPNLVIPLCYVNDLSLPQTKGSLLSALSLICFFLAAVTLFSSHRVTTLLPLASKVPAFAKVTLKADQALWARAVAAFLQAGTPLPEALDKCHDLPWSDDLSAELKELEERVRQGDSFSQALSTTNLVDPQIRWAVTAGESREDLSATLLYAAEGLEHGLMRQCQAFMVVLQPVAIALIGLATMAVLAPFWWAFYHYSWNLGLPH